MPDSTSNFASPIITMAASLLAMAISLGALLIKAGRQTVTWAGLESYCVTKHRVYEDLPHRMDRIEDQLGEVLGSSKNVEGKVEAMMEMLKRK